MRRTLGIILATWFCFVFASSAFAGELEDKLFDAAFEGQMDLVRLLIVNGADVNAKGNYDVTALMLAASEGYKDIAELLIANGADVNASDTDGYTVLDQTCAQDRDMVSLLKAAGAKGTPEDCDDSEVY